MNMTEIPRIKLRLPETPVIDGLADEAAAVLGYARPTLAPSPMTRLRAVLAHLDIEVLDGRAVERYQLEKQFEAERRTLASEHANEMWESSQYFGHERYPSHSWSQVPLSAYVGDVPDYVINKALQIKKALPEVEFLVQRLGTTPDPFLIARVKFTAYQYEAYYVEVWDEPDFTK